MPYYHLEGYIDVEVTRAYYRNEISDEPIENEITRKNSPHDPENVIYITTEEIIEASEFGMEDSRAA